MCILFSVAVAALVVINRCAHRNYVSYTDTFDAEDVTLFYAAEGRGKPVILLHGNGGSHNDMETTTRQLAQSGYTVYVPLIVILNRYVLRIF